MHWGPTPAVDLLSLVKPFVQLEELSEVNILLLGNADCRNVLKTIASLHSHPQNVKVNFYILDPLLEFTARQLLFLYIVLEPDSKLGLQEKTRLFMEIYGNSLLRPTTAEYLYNKSWQLLQIITNQKFLNFKFNEAINLKNLKYSEIDQLENIFKFWFENKDFNIVKEWDGRLRKYLNTRYDGREGAFDWDYHMKLKEVEGAEVVNYYEYLKWRNSGVAFTWLEVEASVTNPTLALGILPKGDKLIHHGYLGDINIGPYFSYGITCENETMLSKQSNVFKKRSTDITEYNLSQICFQIQNKISYSPSIDDINLGLSVLSIGQINERKFDPKILKEKDDYSSIKIDNVKINFLSPLTKLGKTERFKNIFNIIYISQHYLKKFTSEMMKVAQKDCIVIIESTKYFFNLKKNDFEAYEKEVNEFAKVNNLEKLREFSVVKDCEMLLKMK